MQHHRVIPASTGPKKYREHPPTAARSTASPESPLLPAPRRLVWLLLHKPERLDAADAATLAHIQQHPAVQCAHALAQQFQAMVRQRTEAGLDDWLLACAASGIPELQSFAQGLKQEYASIRAALREPWSTGQAEGQITRLKYLKRQMYGRAAFDLLKRRVLCAA